jgi:hypothetical protein
VKLCVSWRSAHFHSYEIVKASPRRFSQPKTSRARVLLWLSMSCLDDSCWMRSKSLLLLDGAVARGEDVDRRVSKLTPRDRYVNLQQATSGVKRNRSPGRFTQCVCRGVVVPRTCRRMGRATNHSIRHPRCPCQRNGLGAAHAEAHQRSSSVSTSSTPRPSN